MKKHIFVLLVPLLFTLIGCKDSLADDETLVEGTITEFGSKKPVPNVPVKIRKISAEFLGPTRYAYTGDSTVTDSKGYYQIRFKHVNAVYDAVWFEKRYTGDNGAILDNGKRNKYDFVLNAPAWIKVRITNTSGSTRDTVFYENANPYTGVGLDVIPPFYPYLGNRYNGVSWIAVKNGQRTFLLDSIYCPAFDTVNYQIKF
jgi:acyl-CoA synthetase (AMP-forming)/AMP-acid ligase II